jgi:hypothetical protein
MPQTFIFDPQDKTLRGQPARITIFVGAYGSGKSEISVNFALWLARDVQQTGQRVVLCDLDTINPYYRSADARQILEAAGVELIAPIYARTNVDVPAVPAGVFSVFDDPSVLAVLDIGGEDLGARVLASMRERLAGQDAAINLVVNPHRLATGSTEGIAATADLLQSTIGLPLSGLVDNANLLEPDNYELLTQSLAMVEEGARLAKLPVLFGATMAPAEIRAGWPPIFLPQAAQPLPLLPLSHSIYYPTDPAADLFNT